MRDKVRNVFSTKTCFGAVLLDKRLVTWGNDFDARRSEIQAQLHDIVSMYGTGTTALAALKEDGRVVAWGAHRWQGCPEPGVRSLLVDVKTHMFYTSGLCGTTDGWHCRNLGPKRSWWRQFSCATCVETHCRRVRWTGWLCCHTRIWNSSSLGECTSLPSASDLSRLS